MKRAIILAFGATLLATAASAQMPSSRTRCQNRPFDDGFTCTTTQQYAPPRPAPIMPPGAKPMPFISPPQPTTTRTDCQERPFGAGLVCTTR